MNLKAAAILLGTVIALCGVSFILSPERVPAWLKRAPRNVVLAWLLTAIDLGGAAVILGRSTLLVRDAWATRTVLIVLPVAFLCLVLFLDELLAARSFGGLLALAGAPYLDIARWHPSPWRLVIPVLTYVWIIAGMTLMLSPFRFRQTIEVLCRTARRSRTAGVTLLGLGVFVISVAIAAY